MTIYRNFIQNRTDSGILHFLYLYCLFRSDLGFLYKEAPARPKKPPRLHTYEPPRDYAILATRNNNNKDDSSGTSYTLYVIQI